MSIGLRIRSLRNENKLSQDEFALSIGIKRANLGQIELGNQLPTLKILTEIARKYHISYDYLLDGSINTTTQVGYSDKNTSDRCKACIEKDKVISTLEKYNYSLEQTVADQRARITALESGSKGESYPTKQTG